MTQKQYEVVLWEQRRIAIMVKADSAEAARDEALTIWECSSEEDMELLEQFTIDNHDIKSRQVHIITPDGQAREILDD